jgi:hypothetical protein
VRLAGAGLPIGQYCCVVAVEELGDQRFCGSIVHNGVAVAASYYTFIAVVVRAATDCDAAAVLVDRAHVLHIFIGLVGQEGAASYYYFDGRFGHGRLLLCRAARRLFSPCGGSAVVRGARRLRLIAAARRRAPLLWA